jgi:DNA topoisomerase-3
VKLKMPNFLSSEGKGCDYLVLWLDCDKEGENICFEVIECVMETSKLKKSNILRAHFSSITDKDIR